MTFSIVLFDLNRKINPPNGVVIQDEYDVFTEFAVMIKSVKPMVFAVNVNVFPFLQSVSKLMNTYMSISPVLFIDTNYVLPDTLSVEIRESIDEFKTYADIIFGMPNNEDFGNNKGIESLEDIIALMSREKEVKNEIPPTQEEIDGSSDTIDIREDSKDDVL